MSREVVSSLFLYLVTFFLFTVSKTSANDLSDECLKFDIAELEDYLSKLDSKNLPTIRMMVGEFKCPLNALPFGALKSDWARLLLLQKAQPNDSIFEEKLSRLFRILLVAYFRTEERFDVVEQDLRTTKRFSQFNVGTSTEVTLTKEFVTSNELTSSTTESSISKSNTPNESRTKNNVSIPTFAITNATGRTTFTSHKKSIAENVEDQQTTESIFATEVSITSTDMKRDFARTKGRGDFPVFHDSSNVLPSDENTLSEEDDLKFITMQYHNATNRNFVEFEKTASQMISNIKETTQVNYDYSSSRNSIFQVLKNTTLSWNKIKESAILRTPPPSNDFWKHVVNSRNITLAPPTNMIPASEDTKMRSKKRASLNTSMEKNFRWFYNLGQEEKRTSNVSAEQRGINIECSRQANEK
ncbi:uncharacterized protein LOC114877378 isoform X2 [Osmia bicornis bicornis]|uniref:uncharacterized protein LOC114877378 isoform X2 n=1 Tax=Osmia bicornis bicornis TaxID=1437191 RepID=UPI001EAF03FA|nr:uncharacterized protein LOC114877378 isoform X2 [Osmia bicornis bicornis]